VYHTGYPLMQGVLGLLLSSFACSYVSTLKQMRLADRTLAGNISLSLEAELKRAEAAAAAEKRLRADLRNLKEVQAKLESTEARSALLTRELSVISEKMAASKSAVDTLTEAHRLADTLQAGQEEVLYLRIKYSKTSKATKELRTHQEQLTANLSRVKAEAEAETAAYELKASELDKVSSSKATLEMKVAKLTTRLEAQRAQTSATEKNLMHAKNRARMEVDKAQAEAAKIAVRAQQGHEEVENLRLSQNAALAAVVNKIDGMVISGMAMVNEVRAQTSPSSKRPRND